MQNMGLNVLDKEQIRFKLVAYANSLGYGVDFESLEGEGTPSGVCVTTPDGGRMIFIRKGKGPKGVITSLIHEIVHAANRKDNVLYVGAVGQALEEWECESVAHFVTQLIGIDRRKQTTAHVQQYVGAPVFSTNERVGKLATEIYNTLK
jgi:hypothetical protein